MTNHPAAARKEAPRTLKRASRHAMTFWYRIGFLFSKFIARFFCSLRVRGTDALRAREGGALIASNHVSFLDPPLIGVACGDEIHYFARRSLFDTPVLSFLLPRFNAIPVTQQKPELSSLKRVIRLLEGGEKVLIFPEGERSWDGELKMEGQPGIGMIVSRARVPVLPVRLFGAEKALPRGARMIRRHPVTLVVGSPVDFTDIVEDESLSTKERYTAVAARIMEEIAALRLEDSRGE